MMAGVGPQFGGIYFKLGRNNFYAGNQEGLYSSAEMDAMRKSNEYMTTSIKDVTPEDVKTAVAKSQNARLFFIEAYDALISWHSNRKEDIRGQMVLLTDEDATQFDRCDGLVEQAAFFNKRLEPQVNVSGLSRLTEVPIDKLDLFL